MPIVYFAEQVLAKGQTKSEWLFQADQKMNEGILLYYEISGRLVFVCFLKEIEDT